MIKQIYSILIISALTISAAQSQTYIRDYTYKASDADSKITCRTNALDQVKAILLQEIGTHIRQKINIQKDRAGNTFASEDIEAITAGLTKVEIIEEKWNGETFFLKARIEADTDRVLNALEEFKNNKTDESKQQLKALKANQQLLKAAREEVSKLRNQLTLANSRAEKERIIVKYIKQNDEISLTDMFNKGFNSYQQRNYHDAANWYRKAADKGHVRAQYNLGCLYEKGHGVKKDYMQAILLITKAAKQGHMYAQNHLGALYSSNRAVKKDPVKSLYWYREAAEQGLPIAQFNLAQKYKLGIDTNVDYTLAAKWLNKAYENGKILAATPLGDLYEKGLGVKQNYAKAFQLRLTAALPKYNDYFAQVKLGDMYKNGLGVKQDYAQALEIYRKTAKKGGFFLGLGLARLGGMYEKGLGVKQDYAFALQLYKKSVKQNSWWGHTALGNMYEKGLGVKQDYAKAVKLYQIASKKEDPIGEAKLGDMYDKGHGVKQDKTIANSWYKKSCENGYKIACSKL